MVNERTQKAKSKNTFVVILGIASLISLALAPILGFIPTLILTIFQEHYFLYTALITSSIQYFEWSLIGSLLSICLLLLCTSTKKKGLSIIFTALSIMFIGVQLLGVVLGLLDAWIGLPIFINSITHNISGWSLLSNIWYLLETPLYRWDLSMLLNNLSYLLCNALYILPNLLCLVGFIKLALTKKPTKEAEVITTEECVKAENNSPTEVCEPVEIEVPVAAQPVVETTTTVNASTEESCFCRKCGTQLPADSDFCHKCGTKAIR